MKNLICFIFGISLLLSQSTLAEKVLSLGEVKALFTGVTFDGRNELKEKNFEMYFSPDGTAVQKKSNGKRRRGEWSIDENGRHCIEFNNFYCAYVTDMGEGIYHKYMNNVHSHTLKNFRKGNQL